MKHEELTEKIIGVFYRVYKELGHGFLESVYEEAMAISLSESGLVVARQSAVPVWFHGKKIGDFKADLVVNNLVLLELKALKRLEQAH
jgi:GxxExxY protein